MIGHPSIGAILRALAQAYLATAAITAVEVLRFVLAVRDDRMPRAWRRA